MTICLTSWGAAQIMAISWADGALQRWYYFAMRPDSAQLGRMRLLASAASAACE